MPEHTRMPQPLKLFPEKLFYKIGEVSRLVGVESYVLRYWETEFSFLNPRKSKSGQRIYAKNDVDLILQIKHLLYEEKYTIDGVRRKLGGDADYQITKRWGVSAGVEFQDLGTYDHTFDGRQVSLDLSRSVLVLVGISYNF